MSYRIEEAVGSRGYCYSLNFLNTDCLTLKIPNPKSTLKCHIPLAIQQYHESHLLIAQFEKTSGPFVFLFHYIPGLQLPGISLHICQCLENSF